MKKFSTFKIIQLSSACSINACKSIFPDETSGKAIYILIYCSNNFICSCLDCPAVRVFIFLLIDFNLISTIKLNYHNLYDVAYSDQLSGIPKRFSCDTVIEKIL